MVLTELELYEESKLMYQRVLTGRQNLLGENHIDTLSTLNNLAILIKREGDLDKAKSLYERVLSGYEKTLGADHQYTLSCQNNLAVLLKQQMDLEGAEKLYRKALAGRQKLLGLQHFETSDTMNNLAVLLFDMGKNLDEAEDLFRLALAGRGLLYQTDHPIILKTMLNLANLLKNKGKLEESKNIYIQILNTVETNSESNYLDIISISMKLADIYIEMDNNIYAQKQKETISNDNDNANANAENDNDNYNRVNNIASSTADDLSLIEYPPSPYLEEAHSLYSKILAHSESHLGYDHPETLSIEYNLSIVANHLGNFDEGKKLYERALAGFEKFL